MEKRTTGLILGKFAPFHKGHQYLVETALSKVDKLYVLIYEAKQTTDIPLEVRSSWIWKLYPTVTVIVGVNAPECVGYTKEVEEIQNDYITSMMPEKIDYFFSSEPYGEHVSKALGAENVLVDSSRINVPISATLIREDREKSLKYLDPIVNRDVVRKIVFLGAESTGKSTIVEALAKLYNTEFVTEHGRQFWNDNHDVDGKLSVDKLIQLANEHIENEEVAYKKSKGITFVDTNAITTWTYEKSYWKTNQLDFMTTLCKDRYHLCFLCYDDIPFVQDGTRATEEHRASVQNQIIEKLFELNIPFYVVAGPLNKRIETVKSIIFNKFNIVVDNL